MKKILAILLSSSVFSLVFSADNASVTSKGILFKSGAVELRMSYPKLLKNQQAPQANPTVTIQNSDLAELDYGSGTKAVVTLTGNSGTIKFSGRKQRQVHTSILIPLNFSNGGSWEWKGKSGKLPKTLEKAVFFSGNGSKVTIISPSGTAFSLNTPGFHQLQDNRRWKWNTFDLQSNLLCHQETVHFSWQFKVPEKKTEPWVDKYGQNKRVNFPEKIRNDEDLKADIKRHKEYFNSLIPPQRDKWGGLLGSGKKFNLKKSGFFRTDTVNGRSVLVTPEGNVFFQVGCCAIQNCDDYTWVSDREDIYDWLPEDGGIYSGAFRRGQAGKVVSFYITNYIRKTGKPYIHAAWQQEAIIRLKKWGFNSHGGFSTPRKETEKLHFAHVPFFIADYLNWKKTSTGIIDPFNEHNIALLEKEMLSKVAPKANDPAIIGYFSGNERHYNGTALGILRGRDSAAKREFIRILKEEYQDIAAFNQAWGMNLSDWDALKKAALLPKTETALQDEKKLETHFFESYFKWLYTTFRKHDPNHLYLGERFLPAMTTNLAAVKSCAKYAEVISVNYYTPEFDRTWLDDLAQTTGRPLILSEWSYGSAEQGQYGVINRKNQQERGLAYRRYAENAAAHPAVVGFQWFAYMDQSISGRWFQKFNGESMNIGLINVADRPYKTFLEEVMKSNYKIYEIKLGEISPLAVNKVAKAEEKLVQIARVTKAAAVDGRFDEYPGRPSEPIRRSVDGRKPQAGDQGDFWCAWDTENLYIYLVVKDATPARNIHSGKSLWIGDSVELFIGTDLRSKGGLKFTDRQLIVGAVPGETRYQWYNSVTEMPVQTAVNIAPDKKSYRMEIAVPWKELKIVPVKGLKLRFDLGIDFSDGGMNRLNQLMWNGSRVNNTARQDWGTAVLID